MIVGAVLSAILLISLIAFPRHLKSVVIGLLLIWTTTAAFVIYDWQRGSQRLEHIIATASFDAACPDRHCRSASAFVTTMRSRCSG